MQKRKMTCHHYGLPAIWGLKNAIRMPLVFDIALTMGSQRFFFRQNRFPIRSLAQCPECPESGKWVHGLGVRTWLHARVMRTVRLLPQTPSNYI